MTKTFEEVWSEMTGQQHHAFHMKVWAALGGMKKGAENMERLMAGEIQLQCVSSPLFDPLRGRRIPPKHFDATVNNPNGDFCFIQPRLDYESRYAQYCKFFDDPGLSLFEFERESEALITGLASDIRLSNLIRGVHLPIILPELPKKYDFGEMLEYWLLPRVERALRKEFPNRELYNIHAGEFKGSLTTIDPGYSPLLKRLISGPPRVALFFPSALQGYSVKAQRAQMDTLPEDLYLAGSADTAVAITMYPDVLARNGSTPGLYMPALCWKGHECLGFKAVRGGLKLSSKNETDSRFSAGLVYLG